MAEIEKEHILIVDDEDAIRRVLKQKLLGEGYICDEANNAAQALEKLENTPIDAVLLDVKMPDKLGDKLLLEIEELYPDLVVIMATGFSDTDLAIQCMKHGAYDYLTKPFNLEEVGLSLERALEKRRLKLEIKDYQQHLERKVEEQAQKIRGSFIDAITSLAYALEAKDKYTNGHSQRVSEISVAIARELGMPSHSIEAIRLAGLLHDIGKIGINESILNKPTKLTEEEFEKIKRHCEIGEHILRPIVDDEEILDMVRHHHERYDGDGYPDGLSGNKVSLGARILALCDAYDAITAELLPGAKILAVSDAYDAMTSDRPYREPLSAKDACAEIARCKGTHFDPEVVDAFLRVKQRHLRSQKVVTSRT